MLWIALQNFNSVSKQGIKYEDLITKMKTQKRIEEKNTCRRKMNRFGALRYARSMGFFFSNSSPITSGLFFDL